MLNAKSPLGRRLRGNHIASLFLLPTFLAGFGAHAQTRAHVASGVSVAPRASVVSSDSVSVISGAATTTAGSANLGSMVHFSGSVAPQGAVSFHVNGGPAITPPCYLASPGTMGCGFTYDTTGMQAGTYPVFVTVAADANYAATSAGGSLTLSAPQVDSISLMTQTYVGGAASSPLAADINFATTAPAAPVVFQVDGGAALNGTCNVTAATTLHCITSYPTAGLTGSHTLVVTVLADGHYNSIQSSAPLAPGTYKPLVTITVPTASIVQGASTVNLAFSGKFQPGVPPSAAPYVTVDGTNPSNVACNLTGTSTATCGISYPTGSLTAGNHRVDVTVPGDGNYNPSSGFGLLTVYAPTTTGKPSIWVAGWADSPTDASSSAQDQTFRQIVKPTVGSRGTVRLHFSNYFGSAAVTLGAVTVGLQTTGSAVSGTVPITFNGQTVATIPPNGFLTSDPVTLNFSYGATLAISEYVSGSVTALTRHLGSGLVTSYTTAAGAGDHTRDLSAASFGMTTSDVNLLDRVDLLGDYTGTVVAFGSSTTEGLGSGGDQHQTYPEQLADALHATGRDDVAIANAGISGDQLILNGLSRYSRDVLAIPGIYGVIDYMGANDLRLGCVDAVMLLNAKNRMIQQTHAAAVRFFEASTAPSTFCGSQQPSGQGTRYQQGAGEEAQRFALIQWQGATQPLNVNGLTLLPPAAEGLIDFNAAITDPSNASYMLPSLEIGDDIHPNNAGYAAMVRAIPLSLF